MTFSLVGIASKTLFFKFVPKFLSFSDTSSKEGSSKPVMSSNLVIILSFNDENLSPSSVNLPFRPSANPAIFSLSSSFVGNISLNAVNFSPILSPIPPKNFDTPSGVPIPNVRIPTAPPTNAAFAISILVAVSSSAFFIPALTPPMIPVIPVIIARPIGPVAIAAARPRPTSAPLVPIFARGPNLLPSPVIALPADLPYPAIVLPAVLTPLLILLPTPLTNSLVLPNA